MACAYLGIGSNLGDRRANLAAALAALSMLGDIDAISPVYETEPVGLQEQPDFWNLVLRLRTSIPPAELLQAAKTAERRLGRTRTVPDGPRVIDIDLLLYDDVVVHGPGLNVPHPRMMQRAFVLRPLLDIDPGLTHPVTGEALADTLAGGTFERVIPLFPGEALLAGRPPDRR
ncbi:MAG: 2-amino-4-hydroxy-6-hydroxymethyldihydropteridine diphosphokinase [Longimicrobiales bacterium]